MKKKLLFLVLFQTIFYSLVFADENIMGSMMGDMSGHHTGWMGFMGLIFMIFIMILILLTIAAIVKYLFFNPNMSNSKALDILKERFVKGDINQVEFEDKRKSISKLKG